MNVLAKLNTITKTDSLDAWVDSVTIRSVRHELRRRKIRRAIFLKSSKVDIDKSLDKNSPFKQTHIRSFYKILDSMPADDRILFVLRYLEKYTVDEIATFGSYSHSTAKRRLKKAKSLFVKRALKEVSLISLLEEYHAT